MSSAVDADNPSGAPIGSGERLEAQIEASLLKGPHGDMVTIMSGVIVLPIIFMYASFYEHQTTLAIIAGICLIAGVIRLTISIRYRKFANVENVKFWKALTLAAIVAFSASMGLFVYAAIAWTDDYRLHFVAAVLTAGYSAGSVGLNAAVQAGFPVSLFASAIPAAIALAERDEPIYRMMSVATILYIVALRMTSKSIHDQMVSSLKSGAEKAQLLLAITEKSERFDSALSNMPQGLAMVDADCRVVVINKKLHELLGLPTIEDNIRIDALFELSARNEVLPPASIRDLNRRVRDSAHNETQKEIKIDTISGQTLEITFQPMSRGGSVVIVTDVTEKKALDRFTHLAHHDTLTGLPNRMFFEKRFAATLVAAEQGDERIAVIALDLDHFKAVNDTLGHQVGDELLKAVAKRIQGRLRADDFVSRIGGDEFMLIHVGASSDSAEKLARRMIDVVSAPYDIEGKEIVIGLTAGIAHFPEDGAGAAELLRNADIALYQGKNAGRGVLHLFERRTAGEAGHRKAV